MNPYWIALAFCIAVWWVLYGRVSDVMTRAGIGWINAIQPESPEQFAAASKATLRKHMAFAVLMFVMVVGLARVFPHYRGWTYGIGIVWSVGNGLVYGVITLVAVVLCWIASV